MPPADGSPSSVHCRRVRPGVSVPRGTGSLGRPLGMMARPNASFPDFARGRLSKSLGGRLPLLCQEISPWSRKSWASQLKGKSPWTSTARTDNATRSFVCTRAHRRRGHARATRRGQGGRAHTVGRRWRHPWWGTTRMQHARARHPSRQLTRVAAIGQTYETDNVGSRPA